MAHRIGALAASAAEKDAEKGRVQATRVKRYWAGKAPEWLLEQPQDQLGDREVVRTEIAPPVIVKKADPRLARLAASRSEDVEEVRSRHREVRTAELVKRAEDEQLERRARSITPGEDYEPDIGVNDQYDKISQEIQEIEEQKRRQAVRERLVQQQREAEAVAQQQGDEEEEEEEEESEYETESEDEGYGRKLLKPVFVPKESRDTIAERERLEKEEEEAEQREKLRAEQRKTETRQIVAEHIAAEAQAQMNIVEEMKQNGAELEDVDTDDEQEQVEAFESWKQRELARIKRDREEKDKWQRQADERERLKHMTEDERREWEKANPKVEKPKSKEKWRFLQKYWHKGAFFQDDADDSRGTAGRSEVYDRDYSAPTGEDKFNKEMLPKVMQVRNFGRAGRTKWSHLLAEDTTSYDDPLIKTLAEKRRAVGATDDMSKPKKFKT